MLQPTGRDQGIGKKQLTKTGWLAAVLNCGGYGYCFCNGDCWSICRKAAIESVLCIVSINTHTISSPAVSCRHAARQIFHANCSEVSCKFCSKSTSICLATGVRTPYWVPRGLEICQTGNWSVRACAALNRVGIATVARATPRRTDDWRRVVHVQRESALLARASCMYGPSI